MRRILRTIPLCLWVALAAGALRAQPVTGDAPYRAAGLDQDTVTFVLGNVQFVVLHELAHLVIGEFGVPVFGPEETAADYIAATALIGRDREDPAANRRSLEYLLAAADALIISWQQGTALGVDVPYWGAHALSIQRFYQVACLLYGSDPRGFEGLPARVGMPEGRAAGCSAEFRQAERALVWLLNTYGRKPGDAPGEPVRVSYEPPRTLAAQQLAAEIRGSELLETLARRLGERFVLPGPVRFVMRSCGRSEAAWQPARRELVICYELLDTFYRFSGLQHREDRRELLPGG